MTALGSTVSNTYRADSLRASKTTSSGTTYFLYDGAEPIVEMNSSGTVTATNVFAPDGLVARKTSSGTTEYVFDQQGNVADRTNTSGAVQSVTQYDGWGNEQAISGTPSDPFGYNAQSGYYMDRQTGLYLCQHRFYDASNGHWINRDPIGYGGGTNLYGYCAGGPTGGVDSSGFEFDKVAAVEELGDIAAEEAGLGNSVAARAAGYIFRNGRWIATAVAAAGGVSAEDPDAPEQVENECQAAADRLSQLLQQARDLYPKLANKVDEEHHVVPQYMGGDKGGTTVNIPAPYHQFITNAFRGEWPYGQEEFPNPDQLADILRRVYEKYPIRGFPLKWQSGEGPNSLPIIRPLP